MGLHFFTTHYFTCFVVQCSGHTKTSMLRTLNSSGRFSPNEWLLPETRALFERQAEKQKQLAIGMVKVPELN